MCALRRPVLTFRLAVLVGRNAAGPGERVTNTGSST